ncbi:UNVERIFIED_CONTAM: hypothetical protein K2H54_051649 [Gekko kuhli]
MGGGSLSAAGRGPFGARRAATTVLAVGFLLTLLASRGKGEEKRVIPACGRTAGIAWFGHEISSEFLEDFFPVFIGL